MHDTDHWRFESWFAELTRLAAEQELRWCVSPSSSAHRLAFDQGLAPSEELMALKDMSEWRGCGCGGA
jgi:hypothetical protein